MKLSSDNAEEIAVRINDRLRGCTYTTVCIIWQLEIHTGQRMTNAAEAHVSADGAIVGWADTYGGWSISTPRDASVYVEGARVVVHFTSAAGHRCSWYFVLEPGAD